MFPNMPPRKPLPEELMPVILVNKNLEPVATLKTFVPFGVAHKAIVYNDTMYILTDDKYVETDVHFHTEYL